MKLDPLAAPDVALHAGQLQKGLPPNASRSRRRALRSLRVTPSSANPPDDKLLTIAMPTSDAMPGKVPAESVAQSYTM
jgi:hypothetical protein